MPKYLLVFKKKIISGILIVSVVSVVSVVLVVLKLFDGSIHLTQFSDFLAWIQKKIPPSLPRKIIIYNIFNQIS